MSACHLKVIAPFKDTFPKRQPRKADETVWFFRHDVVVTPCTVLCSVLSEIQHIFSFDQTFCEAVPRCSTFE